MISEQSKMSEQSNPMGEAQHLGGEQLRVPEFVTLYRRAFAEYGVQALWNMRLIEEPTPADALAITRPLRTYGGMDGRRLAERIESLCNATQ